MSRQVKPVAIIKAEGRTHLTKQQIAQREQAERSWRTGQPIELTPEIEHDPVALTTFERVTKLLERMDANDEVFGSCTRRYCLTTSALERAYKEMDEWEAKRHSATTDKERRSCDRIINRYFRLTKTLYKELRQYERENYIHEAYYLPDKKEAEPDLLMRILGLSS